MIELHSFDTPNGRKVAILLEELGVPYRAHKIDILAGDQHQPEFVAISPNHKIPAIVDPEGPDGTPMSLFESGAILIYLADKYGRFLPREPVPRSVTLQWLFWQVGSVGPFFGQAGHFARFAPEDLPYAKQRYIGEVERLLKVTEARLAQVPWLAGAEYSIADIATAPWVAGLEFYGLGSLLDEVPRTSEWLATIRARPAVQRGWDAISDAS